MLTLRPNANRRALCTFKHSLEERRRRRARPAHALIAVASLAALSISNALGAEQTIPTAAAGTTAPRCTVGQPCTFAAPIFACDYASAEKIATAGTMQGIEIGAGLVRAATCRSEPAGRPFATEATKSPQIVYLTDGGQHLGYMPVGVFAPASVVVTPVPEPSVTANLVRRLADFEVTSGRAPLARAVSLTGQGSALAVGVFRAGPAERRAL